MVCGTLHRAQTKWYTKVPGNDIGDHKTSTMAFAEELGRGELYPSRGARNFTIVARLFVGTITDSNQLETT